jgi:ribonucleoside-triphosphate reductase
MKAIVCAMKEAGIGYGSINHPVDRCLICGHKGIINNHCPKCGEDDESHFERIRRITGYLVGSLDKWNSAKRAEERERVKHS